MWHRLPFESEAEAAGLPSACGRGAPHGERRRRFPPAARRSACRAARIRSAGTTSIRRSASTWPPFAIERHDVTNARYLEFVDAGGYRDPRWWRPEDWEWLQRETVTHPLFWERQDDRWHWRGMFELVPLPPAGRSTSARPRRRRSRAGAAPGCRPKRNSSARHTGPPDGERVHPWGDAEPDPIARRLRFLDAGIRRRPARILRVRAPGVSKIWSATAGNGRARRSRPFPGFQPMPSYPEYSADFFDGEHFVMKGASMATARELLASGVPKLVPSPISVCLCNLPLRGLSAAVRAERRSHSLSATSSTTSRCRRDSCRRAISTTRSALRCSRRSASCRGIAITRAERALLARHAGEIFARIGRVTDARRARPGQRRQAGARSSRARRTPRRTDRAPGRRLGRRARPRRPDARRARPDLDVVAHQATYETASPLQPDARAPAAGCWRCSSARTSATSIRPAPTRSCCGDPRGRSQPGDALLSAPISSSRKPICCWPTTIRSASPPRSTATCSCASTASSAPTSTSTRFAHHACGTRTNRASRCTSSPTRRQHVRDSRRRRSRSTFEPGETIWTESSYKYQPRRRRRDAGARRISACRGSGSTRTTGSR